MTFFERLSRLRFAVTPGLVGRAFRAFSSAGRRLDAENVAIGTFVEGRKANRWMHFDVAGTINRYVSASAAAGVVPFYGDNGANGLGFVVGQRVVQYDPSADTAAAIEIVGWSIIIPDFQFMFARPWTFELWYNAGALPKATATWDLPPAATDFDVLDSFQSIFGAPVVIDPAFPVFVRLGTTQVAVAAQRQTTSAVCTAVLHFRALPLS